MVNACCNFFYYVVRVFCARVVRGDNGKIALSGTSEELLASEKVQEAYLGKKH